MRMPAAAACLVACILVVGPILAGPGEAVDVRVVDASSNETLEQSRLTVEHRLEITDAPDHLRYLGLRREQFRGQQVLEISLAGAPGVWERMSYSSWNEPSSNTFGGIRLELVPRGWADRYCRALATITSPARRDPAVSIRVDGAMHISEPGWTGQGTVNLRSVSNPDAGPTWQARIDGDGRLHIRTAGLGTWRQVDPVRDDFYMLRYLWHEAGRLQVTYEPSAYGQRFCGRYVEQGERYASAIVDYIFGRDAAGTGGDAAE